MMIGELKLLFIIIVIVVAIVGRVVRWFQEMAAEEARKARQRAQGTPRQTAMDDEIGEFLRKASQGRAGGQAVARPPQPASRPSRKALRQEPVEVVAIEESPERFKPLESGLATQAQTDAAMEGHLRQVFGQGLGQLSAAGQSPASAASSAAVGGEPLLAEAMGAGSNGLAVLLASSAAMRRAIVLNEIIQRPLDRWR
jgi:hypothetical protein